MRSHCHCHVCDIDTVSYVTLFVCVTVDEISALVTRTGRSVTIGCVISTSERIRAEIEWYKDDRMIVDDGGVKYSITRNETKSILNITKVCESLSLCVYIYVCLSV